MKHKIIPDEFSYAFAIIAFLLNFVNFDYANLSITYGLTLNHAGWVTLLSGVFVAFPFYFIWLISDGRWMGLGDAKLALGIGWLLGIKYGFSAVVFAFWIGAIVSLTVMGSISLIKMLSKGKGSRLAQLNSVKFQSEIPFAPFLILGLLIVFFLNISAIDVVSLLTL